MSNEECESFLAFRIILGQFDARKVSLHFACQNEGIHLLSTSA